MDKNKRQLLLNWQIGFNESGRFVTAIHTPPGLAITKDDHVVGGGILVANGMELKFGSGQPRRLTYVSCTPRQCMAEAAIDDGFIKEALASSEATLTVHTVGGPIPLDVSVKGIDKAISSTRTR
jgi:invasion protein IalB